MMNTIGNLLKRLDGLYFSQDYLCLSLQNFNKGLHVYRIENNCVVEDVSQMHHFVGYCPLIFAFPFFDTDTVHLAFCQESFKPNDIIPKKDALAVLQLKKIRQWSDDGIAVGFYEGINGSHRFVPSFQRWVGQVYNRMYNQKQGNVFLRGNLFDQVQIAYSVPRKISLVTTGNGDFYNLFPTDLQGRIDNYYFISLRHEGKACQQVLDVGKLVLSEMNALAYKQVYALGKNHMQPLKAKENFPFGNKTSLWYQLPIPQNAVGYKELQLLDSFIRGIHRIFAFSIIHVEQTEEGGETLVHIHNAYATWRKNHGINSNYLLR